MQCNPANDTFGSGAGAGGGALLIASSTRVTIAGSSGKINGNGGDGGDGVSNKGAAGAGGAIRLISNTISADFGILSVNGGCGFNATEESTHNGGGGRIRVEAYSISLIGTVLGSGGCGPAAFSESAPFPLLLPTAGPPTARVVSIAGILVNPNPSTFPDITINTTIAVPVVIQTHNIPTTATVNLTILDQNGVPDTVIPAPPLGNCDQNNFCTTTVNVVFPFGASRGLTKVTWTQ